MTPERSDALLPKDMCEPLKKYPSLGEATGTIPQKTCGHLQAPLWPDSISRSILQHSPCWSLEELQAHVWCGPASTVDSVTWSTSPRVPPALGDFQHRDPLDFQLRSLPSHVLQRGWVPSRTHHSRLACCTCSYRGLNATPHGSWVPFNGSNIFLWKASDLGFFQSLEYLHRHEVSWGWDPSVSTKFICFIHTWSAQSEGNFIELLKQFCAWAPVSWCAVFHSWRRVGDQNISEHCGFGA
jgi:hypothetical protein